jgi:hypothetical protein
MSYKDILNAVDILIEYPDLMEYVKTFDSPKGFMYTRETDINRVKREKLLSDLLDAKGTHSGASWGCMLRGVQSVLNGVNTREYFMVMEKMDEEENQYQEQKQAQADQMQAEQKQAEQQQKQAQAEQKQKQAQAEQKQADQKYAKNLAEFEIMVEKAKKERAILYEAEYKLKY